MTIAACYLSPEGVVLGADSTSTSPQPGHWHYYNHGQKVFELGTNSSLGVVTWGLGGLAVSSYRTLIARFADRLTASPPVSVEEVALNWATYFWDAYTTSPIQPLIDRLKHLHGKGSHDPDDESNPDLRSKSEEPEYQQLKNGLVVGFCIGGYIEIDRTPAAFEIIVDPLSGPPVPVALPFGKPGFWGVPNLIKRLIYGCAEEVKAAILGSDKWAGTPDELDNLIAGHALSHPYVIPIRDAIDFTHACILSTIKAMKFSSLPQVCGGPIEIAVITTDRPFRWVRHKSWDAAIAEGEA